MRLSTIALLLSLAACSAGGSAASPSSVAGVEEADARPSLEAALDGGEEGSDAAMQHDLVAMQQERPQPDLAVAEVLDLAPAPTCGIVGLPACSHSGGRLVCAAGLIALTDTCSTLSPDPLVTTCATPTGCGYLGEPACYVAGVGLCAVGLQSTGARGCALCPSY